MAVSVFREENTLGTAIKDALKASGDIFPDASTTGVSVTFVASAQQITRTTGSFVTDGWVAGTILTVTGSSSNNGSYYVKTVAALSITFEVGTVLTDEGPTSAPTLSNGSPETVAEDTWQTIANELSPEESGDMIVDQGGAGYVRIISTKGTTGNPSGAEGMIVVNTVDNNLQMFADGAWRLLASW